ncbi:MAG: TatD family hydrolase [Oscillospiraceae bacterium]|jgi:TatD DNase family protein|nr:TatD family hydrolase [Oscillospiraceae bacterium]
MTKIFDTHTHYDDDSYDVDRDVLLDALLKEHIGGFIAIGCSVERSRLAVELAGKYDSAYAAVGIHPSDTAGLPTDYLEILRDMTKSQKVKAIGEIGLDYHYPDTDKPLQQKVFREQIALAKELGLPVIVHSRDAYDDTLSIIKDTLLTNAVVHCFSENAERAREISALGLYVSFTGVVTFKNGKTAREALAAVPNERLMLETDCPYLAPEPFRGKRCDSSMLDRVVNAAAIARNVTPEEIVRVSNENAARFFRISID